MLSRELEKTISYAVESAANMRHEFVTLEHLLLALLDDRRARDVLYNCGADLEELKRALEDYLNNSLEKLPPDISELPELTNTFQSVVQYAVMQAEGSGRKVVEGDTLLAAFYRVEHSYAVYLLMQQGISRLDILNYISHGISKINSDPEPVLEAEDNQQGQPDKADVLQNFTTELVSLAQEGKIDPIVGREAELERTIQVLCRRKKNNPLFIGEPGVGKTAIVEGLALRISRGEVPEQLADAKIFSLDLGGVLAGTRYRGDFEQRLKNIIRKLAKEPSAILFIDEIHTIVGAGSVQGGTMDASNILKPFLSSGELRCIGSTTYSEYKASFERDRALARRFQRIEIDEPSPEQTYLILKGLKKFYENHHRVVYRDDALRAAAELAGKYINDRFLPDKAIDVIDEVGASLNLLPQSRRPSKVTPKMVEATIARMAKIPPRSVVSDEKQRLLSLKEELKKVIYGQDEAIDTIVNSIRISRAGLGAENRPIGSFLFSGPTGVGKTELSKQLAAVLGIEFIRFDMSEYAEPHTVSRLIGAPPGYVGFDQGGLLTDAIIKHPHSVLVLDEIEKAHPNLFNLLLQVMDSATLTDNNGKKADFRNVILIMTTNAGAREISSGGIGFQNSAETKGQARGAIERTFAPEFRNRLDAWVAFKPLGKDIVRSIVDKFISELNAQIAGKRVFIKLDENAKDWFVEKGFDSRYGARPMARLIHQKLKLPIAEAILFGELTSGGTAEVHLDNDEITLSFSRHSAS